VNVPYAIAAIGFIIFLAYIFAEVFSRSRVPDVLLLILIGILIGPIFGIVLPSHLGSVGPVFTVITLVLMLFEGGLHMRASDLRHAFGGTLALTLTGFVVTCLMVSAILRGLGSLGLIGTNLLVFLTAGAIVAGTSSAVVIPILSKLTLAIRSRTILIMESALTDVLCIVVALGLLEVQMIGTNVNFPLIGGRMMAAFLIAMLFGIVGGLIWATLLHRVRTLQNSIFETVASIFLVYGVTEMLGFSGPIASLAFGITLGNCERLHRFWPKFATEKPITLNDSERQFFSDAVFLFKTFFFVYVGISIQLTNLPHILLGLLLTILMFLIRIPIVRMAVSRKRTSVKDAAFMAVMIPKGLAAAVLASIPLQRGLESGAFIQNVTFAVVTFSILINSILVFLIEKTPVAGFYYRIFSRYQSDSGQ